MPQDMGGGDALTQKVLRAVRVIVVVLWEMVDPVAAPPVDSCGGRESPPGDQVLHPPPQGVQTALSGCQISHTSTGPP